MNPKPGNTEKKNEVVIPLCSEQLSLSKRRVATGHTRIRRRTREQEQQFEEPVFGEYAEIERRRIGEQVETMPSIRQEGDTIIIPIVEEQLVVERRLVLKEEVRVVRRRRTEIHRERVIKRSQEVVIERLPAQEPQ